MDYSLCVQEALLKLYSTVVHLRLFSFLNFFLICRFIYFIAYFCKVKQVAAKYHKYVTLLKVEHFIVQVLPNNVNQWVDTSYWYMYMQKPTCLLQILSVHTPGSLQQRKMQPWVKQNIHQKQQSNNKDSE